MNELYNEKFKMKLQIICDMEKKTNYIQTKIKWGRIGIIWGIILAVGVINLGCDKENDNIEHNTDEYYVKYEVYSTSMYVGKLNVVFINENNLNQSIQTSRGGKWEIVIGPVKKGFKASLKVNDAEKNLYHLKLSAKISVSKNGSQFADKGIDSSDSYRNSAQTNYTIDY